MSGSALGDAVGISWLLAEIQGVKTVSHGGTTHGQYSSFVMVPDRGFAVISMSNCGPNGPQLNDEVVDWALEHHLGLTKPEPQLAVLGADELGDYAGQYETIAAVVDVTVDGTRLLARVQIKPETAAVLQESGQEVPDEQPPVPLALLAEETNRYVVPEGPGKGMKGYFSRGADGRVEGVHLGGRMATRTTTEPGVLASPVPG
jgi:hypothetical protein